MRTLVFTLLLMGFAFTGVGQNGGQYPENNSVKLEYLGNGKIKITNKQSCESIIHVNDSKTEADLTIAGNGNYSYQLPADLTTNIRFKAKNTTNCGNSDYGLVELFLSSLPLKFVSFNTTRISDTEFWVNFEIAEASNVNHFNIKTSTDGKVYKVITILFPDDLQPNRKYSVKINLSTSVK